MIGSTLPLVTSAIEQEARGRGAIRELPPENADGTTEVVQRVAMKIVFNDADCLTDRSRRSQCPGCPEMNDAPVRYAAQSVHPWTM
jgi:hypothetical protein